MCSLFKTFFLNKEIYLKNAYDNQSSEKPIYLYLLKQEDDQSV